MQITAIMIARVKKAGEAVLHNRQNAYKRMHLEFCTLHASGAHEERLERAKVELVRMAHPIFEAYTLHPVGWSRRWRPKTKEQADKWKSAIRRGILPPGAFVFAKRGSDLLTTGAKVGVAFTQ